MTFRRPSPEQLATQRADRREVNLRALCTPSRSLHRATVGGSTSGKAVEKDAPVRSEAYRRAVAALCCVHCGRAGPSQCAHSNSGKAMAMKSSDLESFPLCPACHRAFDQGALFDKETRRRMEPQWARATRAAIRAAGTWPKNLPELTE